MGSMTFGRISFDMGQGLLSRDGVPLAISHRAIALLRSLVEHQGKPVSKTTLSEAAWPGQIVEGWIVTVPQATKKPACA
jgi:DNA-binding winged helix-turn-helix (wHTH) protein